MQKGDIIVDGFGGELELLTHPTKRGIATVKVIEAGEFLEERPDVPVRKGLVISGFDVVYGLLKYSVKE